MPVDVVVLKARSDNYAYLVRDEATGKVASIDAPEAGPILAALDERGWDLDQLWITHHHADHVEGVEELREKTGCKVVGHVKDIGRLPPLDREVSEGEQVHLGESMADVVDVSGHTIGHIAYIMEDAGVAFTADSLMVLGCGRVFEGTHEMMWKSLEKLMHLPQDIRIYSGHNYAERPVRAEDRARQQGAEGAGRADRGGGRRRRADRARDAPRGARHQPVPARDRPGREGEPGPLRRR